MAEIVADNEQVIIVMPGVPGEAPTWRDITSEFTNPPKGGLVFATSGSFVIFRPDLPPEIGTVVAKLGAKVAERTSADQNRRDWIRGEGTYERSPYGQRQFAKTNPAGVKVGDIYQRGGIKVRVVAIDDAYAILRSISGRRIPGSSRTELSVRLDRFGGASRDAATDFGSRQEERE